MAKRKKICRLRALQLSKGRHEPHDQMRQGKEGVLEERGRKKPTDGAKRRKGTKKGGGPVCQAALSGKGGGRSTKTKKGNVQTGNLFQNGRRWTGLSRSRILQKIKGRKKRGGN